MDGNILSNQLAEDTDEESTAESKSFSNQQPREIKP